MSLPGGVSCHEPGAEWTPTAQHSLAARSRSQPRGPARELRRNMSAASFRIWMPKAKAGEGASRLVPGRPATHLLAGRLAPR
jgi:hypothetical protein